MNISLTPELEELINQKVATGMYRSASEVVREGLRLLREQDEFKRIRLEELRRDVMAGHEQMRRGAGVPFDIDAIEAQGRERIAARRVE